MFASMLEALPLDADRLVIGYSGGLDSSVLLHACATHPALKQRVKAVHVHHGLSPNADEWLLHCQSQCYALGVPFEAVRVTVAPNGNGVEEAARLARYEAFKNHTQAGDVLLLAHHENDQFETFFMRLLRGSGLGGLTGMASERVLNDRVTIYRPWLQVPRSTLEDYARHFNVMWIEDESNNDLRYERNWWRHNVLAPIQVQFPEKKIAFTRTLQQLRNDHAVLQELLEPLIDSVCEFQVWPNCAGWSCNVEHLAEQPVQYWPYLLRGWLARCGVLNPSAQWLTTLIENVIAAGQDAQPQLMIGDWQIQRHKKMLLLVKPVLEVSAIAIKLGSLTSVNWAGGRINAQESAEGIALGQYEIVAANTVRDLKIKIQGRPNKSFKDLFQEANIPVFLRATWPVLMQHNQVVALVGLAVAERFIHESGFIVTWQSY